MRVNLFKKRLKITKNGKIVRRSCSLGHTKAKDSSKVKRRRNKSITMGSNVKSIIKQSH
ncbi:MAG TPA: hypothetical protein VFD40_00610 [Candidatus Paceibacterota bacterium]|nr:hypothetical protein [Candidatus Paceibacterota bacterium]